MRSYWYLISPLLFDDWLRTLESLPQLRTSAASSADVVEKKGGGGEKPVCARPSDSLSLKAFQVVLPRHEVLLVPHIPSKFKISYMMTGYERWSPYRSSGPLLLPLQTLWRRRVVVERTRLRWFQVVWPWHEVLLVPHTPSKFKNSCMMTGYERWSPYRSSGPLLLPLQTLWRRRVVVEVERNRFADLQTVFL